MSISKVRTSKEIYSGAVFSVVSEEIEYPNGLIATRDVVRHPGAVVIIPIRDPQTILFVRQYRHPIGRTILELPAGTLEPGEEPLNCAQREIAEEVGYSARTWTSLGGVFPAPGFCDEYQHLFLATDLYEHQLPGDEDEIIEIQEVPCSAITAMVQDHVIQDGKTLAALFRARLAGLLEL